MPTAPREMVDLLIGVLPVVGLPRVVEAAPKLALALGYDTEETLISIATAHPFCPDGRGQVGFIRREARPSWHLRTASLRVETPSLR